MKSYYNGALRKRESIDKAAAMLTDEQAAEVPTLYSEWASDTAYAVGDRRRYGEKLYRCLVAHTSQADWAPDVAVSLWAEVLIPDPEAIPEWVQPDSTNSYMEGDKVIHNGKTWISLVDNNVWEPGVYGWEVYNADL